MRQLIATILCALLAVGPGYAFADDPPELTKAQEDRVIQLIDTGKAAYNKGQFDESLESFRSAYELYPHPDIVYRMALCYERLGEDQQAVKYYKDFLVQVPDAPERPRIEKTIQVIEARISKSEIRIVTDPDGAIVYIDDVANGAAGYTPTELPVRPGNYRVIVKKEGFQPIEELVEVGSGQSVALRYQLKSVAGGGNSVVTGPGTSDGTSTRKPFDPTWVILFSIGAASLAASVLFYQPYQSARENLEKFDQDRQNVREDIYDQEESSRNLFLGLTIGTAVAGFAMLVWSFIEYRTSNSVATLPQPRDEGFAVGVGPSADGSGALLDLGFRW